MTPSQIGVPLTRCQYVVSFPLKEIGFQAVLSFLFDDKVTLDIRRPNQDVQSNGFIRLTTLSESSFIPSSLLKFFSSIAVNISSFSFNQVLCLHWIKFFVSIAELQFSSRSTKTRIYSILWKITVDRIANTIERCRKFKTFRAHSVKLFFEHSTANAMWGSFLIRFLPENRVERFCSLFLSVQWKGFKSQGAY